MRGKKTAIRLMGWMMGIEPTTTGATIRGSTTELHPPLTKAHLITSDWKTNTDTYLIGTPSRTRTRNLRLRRPLLYPVELWAHMMYPKNTDEHLTTTKIWRSRLTPSVLGKWSGWRDSNPRHPAPKAGALPDCATSRLLALDAAACPVSSEAYITISDFKVNT